jgi:hypothetical protein
MKTITSMRCQTEYYNGEKICMFMPEPSLSQSESIMNDIEILLDILQKEKMKTQNISAVATKNQTNISQ